MTTLGFILSLILVNVEHYLNKKDKLEEEFRKLLPGYNCGACGFGSCDGMAKAMLENCQNYKKCRPLKGDGLREMEMFLKKNHLS